jgi:hypothetical protein
LPEAEMFGCDCDKLVEVENVVAFAELLAEKVDG